MAWTDDRVEILKKLWAEGLSASQIARELGDVTRNAVIGKVHRLGLAGRASPTKPKTRLRHREHIDYAEASYPGDDDFRFCGNHKVNGSPYCAEHTKVAYQPLEKRKKKNKLLNKRKPISKINNF